MLDNMLSFTADCLQELKSDTGWKSLTLSSNWNGADDYCKYRKLGNIVEIRFSVKPKSNLNATDGLLVAYNMPDIIIPRNLTVRGMAYNAGNSYMISIPYKGGTNNGKIRVLGRNALTQGYMLSGQVTYIV